MIVKPEIMRGGLVKNPHPMGCKAVVEKQKFDVILLDPPSFSNSKSMESSFDVQRDHSDLIATVMQLLADGGELIFSNNRRGFKLDDSLNDEYNIENIHQQTIDKDFERWQNER